MVVAFYTKLKEVLLQEERLILMVVIANVGSSPGRKGFKMLVTKSQMFGTIGGGIMEHKLVEYSRTLLDNPVFEPFVKKQVHDKSAFKDQSGMICSGQQTIAFYDCDLSMLSVLEKILNQTSDFIFYTDKKIATTEVENSLCYFKESIQLVQKVYVIGGGHVGLALSEIVSKLDFEIHILDHRDNLNTMTANRFAHFSEIVDFEQIEKYIPNGDSVYVVIMSFGYRTDDIILRRLVNKNFKYIGMLGSKEKIAKLFKNMIADGFDENQLAKVYAPIGVDIKSETAYEIAISVAAQLINVKNRN
jgi:xanthine dehydrogenase accessory factor